MIIGKEVSRNLSKKVGPVYEVAAITKSFDGGPALIFDRIKGYPGCKAVNNLMSRRERIAGFLGVTKKERGSETSLPPNGPWIQQFQLRINGEPEDLDMSR